MSKVMETANSLPLWIIAGLVVSIVIFQAITFIRLASRTAETVGMNRLEVKMALRTGAISSIGPSFAILVVAISLLTLIGNPATLMRIGIIGSAPVETIGATVGAQAAGSELGSADFTHQAFTNAVWVMCLGGIGWLLVTALFTKSLSKVQKKIANNGQKSVTLLKVISTAALLGAFSYLGTTQVIKGMDEAMVFLAAFAAMPLILWCSTKFKLNWLREWSLGLIILVGISVGYFIS